MAKPPMKNCLKTNPLMNILGYLGVCVMHIIIKGRRISLGHTIKEAYFFGILMVKSVGNFTILNLEISLLVLM